jgi:S-DNA-T family DNA segregation ATPase FtsK/SpoIIIE
MKEERVIRLNWFQNFFQKFKKDDEDEFEEYNLHNFKVDTFTTQNSHESSKDLETRISYQYPKGNLPFTVDAKRKNPVERPIQSTRKERRTEIKRNEQAVMEPKKKDEPKPKVERPKPRGPFQPTEIPSPVFGFNRPKRTNDLVEHELSHFTNDPFDTSIVKKTERIPPKKEPATIDISLDLSSREEPIVIEDLPVLISEKEAAVDFLSLESIEQKETEALVHILADELIQQEEKQNQMEQQMFSEDLIVQEEMVDDEPPVLDSSVFQNIGHVSENPDLKRGEELEIQEMSPVNKQEPERGKSHIPFNVMMLKQDKLMWEEQKRGRREQRPLTNQPIEKTVESVKIEEVVASENNNHYRFPSSSLLTPPISGGNDAEWLRSQEELLNETLKNFNVGANVVNVTQGPSVTRFEVQPEPGVKVNKITNLSDDIKLSLAAKDIRIEAPIPGKHTIGIEVPNKTSRPVFINEIITSPVFKESASPLTAVLGLDISGKPIVTDLKKMPHGLIAGATGSGKSVCINTILVSLLYKAQPEDVKLLLIDPKMVELAPYNHIPHLVSPVITDVKAATAALKWAVDEMERRYELFAHTGVRDINRFNELAVQHKRYSDKLPFIVIIIDELADLMMMSPADVEEAICRIAQKARACGIHLIIATQRPSVDVITGLIKANIPTRIAFSVSSQIDSRTIIDISGAEKLLGRGDMLFLENGSSKPVRLQGTFVSDEEIDVVVSHVREQREPEYLFQQEELLKKAQVTEEEDELFYEVCEFIVDQGGASTSSLQRRFKIGYNRAARLMDMLESQGFISGANGSKPREVLIKAADLEMIADGNMIG